ncbi:MAG: hypothetical protein ABSC95_23050 [Acetobacteraceae bacterium]|jgi:hypothetical protein
MAQIVASVGKGATNLADDVRAVQMLLNRFQPHTARLLSVDGTIGPQTIAALEKFFSAHMMMCAEPVVEPGSPTLQALNGGPGDRIAWGGAVDLGFKTKVISIAFDLLVCVDFLMAAMAFESGESFSASVENEAGSGAIGLIQFMPKTATNLGTTSAALAAMTAVAQLDYVKQYFTPYRGKLKTLEDVYMAILYPAAIGAGSDHVLFSSGTLAYSQNAGLDLNGDGSITVGEATSRVRTKYEKGLTGAHIG